MQFDGQATDVPPATKTALQDVAAELRDDLPAGSEVALGGDLFAVSVPGVTITEAIGLLIALLVLIVTFRSFVVAGLPLLTAIIGVGLSISLIFLSTAFASISSTTPLLALMLGLAVGIDYALFIAARHQDQVRAGMDPEESAARATGTAGSAVVFAGRHRADRARRTLVRPHPVPDDDGHRGRRRGRDRGARRGDPDPGDARLPEGSRRRGAPGAQRPAPRAGRRVAVAAGPTAPRSRPSRTGRPGRRTRAGKPGFAARWVALVTKHPVVTTVAVVLTLGIMAIPAASLTLALPERGHAPRGQRSAAELRPGRRGVRPGLQRPDHPHRHDRDLDRPASG